MRIVVPVVVEMTDKQVAAYAEDCDLPVPVRAKDVVASVRRFVLNSTQTAFYHVGETADVSIKER